MFVHSCINNSSTSQIMHHVERIEQRALEVREGEGKNKGLGGDGGKTWFVRGRMVAGFKSHRLIHFLIAPPPPRTSYILLRCSKASLREGGKKMWAGGGRMGGEVGGEGEAAESTGRRERCCVCRRCHSAAARFDGRRVCWREEECGKNWGKENRREGEKGSAWAALQQLQPQQPVRRTEGKEGRGKKEKAAGLPLRKHYFFFALEEGFV